MMDVRVWSADIFCPRCGQEPYLQAALPDPAAQSGYTSVTLCRACDATTPSAEPLLAFFAAHGTLTADNLNEFVELVGEWLADVMPATVRDADLAQLLQRWSADL